MTLPLKKAVDSLFNRCGTTGTYQGREVLFLLSEEVGEENDILKIKQKKLKCCF